MSKKNGSYSPEFREEVARWVVENDVPVAREARERGLKEQTLRNWVSAYKKAHPVEENPLSLSERAELVELRKKCRELELKAEFLGKTAAFFAREYR